LQKFEKIKYIVLTTLFKTLNIVKSFFKNVRKSLFEAEILVA